MFCANDESLRDSIPGCNNSGDFRRLLRRVEGSFFILRRKINDLCSHNIAKEFCILEIDDIVDKSCIKGSRGVSTSERNTNTITLRFCYFQTVFEAERGGEDSSAGQVH